jgi:hypothetical protein
MLVLENLFNFIERSYKKLILFTLYIKIETISRN